MWFLGQNAHDSGNDTWEKTSQNNAVGAWFPKLINKVSTWYSL